MGTRKPKGESESWDRRKPSNQSEP